jgi:hypothetical protein
VNGNLRLRYFYCRGESSGWDGFRPDKMQLLKIPSHVEVSVATKKGQFLNRPLPELLLTHTELLGLLVNLTFCEQRRRDHHFYLLHFFKILSSQRAHTGFEGS